MSSTPGLPVHAASVVVAVVTIGPCVVTPVELIAATLVERPLSIGCCRKSGSTSRRRSNDSSPQNRVSSIATVPESERIDLSHGRPNEFASCFPAFPKQHLSSDRSVRPARPALLLCCNYYRHRADTSHGCRVCRLGRLCLRIGRLLLSDLSRPYWPSPSAPR